MNLLKAYKEGINTDVGITIRDRVFNVHKLILDVNNFVEVKLDADPEIINELFEDIYSNDFNYNDNTLQKMIFAEKFSMSHIKDKYYKIIKYHVNFTYIAIDILILLREMQYDCVDLYNKIYLTLSLMIKQCYLYDNYKKIHEKDMKIIFDLSTGCNSCKVNSVLSWSDKIPEWIFNDNDVLSPKLLKILYDRQYFDKDQYIQALEKGFELIGNPCMTDISPITKTFVYSEDFDTNGFIYYLGTNDDNSFKNPYKKYIKIIPSSIHTGTADIITSRNAGFFWTDKEYCPYIKILFNNVFRLTNITLRHGYSQSDDYLKDWILYGVERNKKIVIGRYSSDKLCGPYKSGTFDVNNKGYYSGFIIQAKSEFDVWLCISGIELYGEYVY